MRQIFRGGVFRLFFMGFNFGVGLLIAALAGPATFGILSLMIVNAAVIHIIIGFGTDAALVYHGSDDQFNKHKSFSIAFFTGMVQVALFLVLAAAYYTISGKLVLSGKQGNGFFFIEFLYFTGIVFTEKYTSLFYARHQQSFCNKVLSIVAAVFFLMLVSLYFFDPPGHIKPIVFFCSMITIQSLVLAIAFHGKNRVGFSSLNRNDLRSFLHFSFLVFVTNAIQFLAYRVDFWFIGYFGQISDIGIYAQAVRLAQLLWIIPNILAAVLIPAIVAAQKGFDALGLVRLIRVLNIVNLIILVGLIGVSCTLYFYFIPDYASGLPSLLLMLPGYLSFSITLLLAAFFSAKRRLLVNFYGSLLCFLVIITADFLLIPRWGIQGAAVSNTIAYGLATIFNIFMFSRIAGIPVKNLFMVRTSDIQQLKKIQY
ncbi:MAG: oligosaccharide flippase family protein [Terrimonas sp.]|nr:oligosaccharide flippase family protein [Terrimonas sp.]